MSRCQCWWFLIFFSFVALYFFSRSCTAMFCWVLHATLFFYTTIHPFILWQCCWFSGNKKRMLQKHLIDKHFSEYSTILFHCIFKSEFCTIAPRALIFLSHHDLILIRFFFMDIFFSPDILSFFMAEAWNTFALDSNGVIAVELSTQLSQLILSVKNVTNSYSLEGMIKLKKIQFFHTKSHHHHHHQHHVVGKSTQNKNINTTSGTNIFMLLNFLIFPANLFKNKHFENMIHILTIPHFKQVLISLDISYALRAQVLTTFRKLISGACHSQPNLLTFC